MRPFRQIRRRLSRCLGVALSLAVGVCFEGCGRGGAVTGPPPLPPPYIVVTVTPNTSTVLLGNAQSFSAQVTNTSNTSVTWSVNGIGGGNSLVGTISPTGVYTAPADLPASSAVQVDSG